MTAADVGAPDDLGGTPGRAAGGPLAARKAPPSRRRALAGWPISLALALLLAFGIRTFVFQAFSIPTTSMVPALDASGTWCHEARPIPRPARGVLCDG